MPLQRRALGAAAPPTHLDANHPIRRAFFRYGYLVARHWLAVILLSATAVVMLCYPVFFLYENPTTGFSKLPLHVWTSARLYDGKPDVPPDVIIRQVWVHGNHMGALNQTVLLEALRIQNIIVPRRIERPTLGEPAEVSALDDEALKALEEEGGDLCSLNSARFISWGLHTPLMLWNCSAKSIRDDSDLIGTVYRQTDKQSYLNLTLRPTSVFAGKSFEKDKVVAADALVITLFGRRTDMSARLWEERIDTLVAYGREKGHKLFPPHGHVGQEHLYEFQQKPLSSRDTSILFVAYSLMAVYVLMVLGKLQAVKSWTGLLVAVMFETGLSIVASFTICGLLKIDLAQVPDAAYPFVVLVLGLENMFRLINAVLSQKPELAPSHRIASALGEVGHLSLSSSSQMLFILYVMAQMASAIRAFCIFAALAVVFDFAFHLTFFLAVLSVDVRRMELRDSIDRAKTAPPGRRQSATPRHERRYYLDALLQGQLPVSTRMAGSAISLVFILGLNMHFYDSNSLFGSLLQSLKSMFISGSNHRSPHFVAPPINQARTPAAWLRIQDYRYAQEVLRYIKPDGHHIIARVYDPLVILLKDSDRRGSPGRDDAFFSLSWSLIRKHLYPFLLAAIFAVAFVTLLMQYLLWNELPDDETDDDDTKISILTTATLPLSHHVDVVRLATSPKGHLISVGLDKIVTFALFDSRTHRYSLNSLYATKTTPPMWPVVAMSIDEQGLWAALCCKDGTVTIWNMLERRHSHTIRVNLAEHDHPMLFSLVPMDTDQPHLCLIIVLPNGQTNVIDPFVQTSELCAFTMGREPLVSATISRNRTPKTIISLGKSGKIRVAVENAGKWEVTAVAKVDPRLAPTSDEGTIKSVSICPTLNVMAACRLRVVDLIDVSTKTLIHSFSALLVRGSSLRILSSPARTCKTCKGSAINSLSLAYIDFELRKLVLRTYAISDDFDGLLCLAPRAKDTKPSCKGLADAKESIYHVDNPGDWEATNVQAVVGVRRRKSTTLEQIEKFLSPGASGFESTKDSTMRRRGPLGQPDLAQPNGRRFGGLLRSDALSNRHEEWEVWTLSFSGEFHVEPVPTNVSAHDDELLTARVGPLMRLGQKSIALGFANRIKIIMLGTERFENGGTEFADPTHVLSGARRRRVGRKGI